MTITLKRYLLIALLSCGITTSCFASDTHIKKDHQEIVYGVPEARYPGGGEPLAFFITTDYTYWVPYQEGMTVAYFNGASGIQGDQINPAMDSASGFKVSLGVNTNHDGWSASINYVWFNYTPAMEVNSLLTDQLYTSSFTSFGGFEAISSAFRTQFNRIDGMVDRNCYMGDHFLFRPWIGLLGAWDQQILNINATIGESPIIEKPRLRQDWWAIGPYAGMEGTYFFAKEWGIFISSGTALLLAENTINTFSSTVNSDTGAEVTTRNTKNILNNVEPMLEIALGLCWDMSMPQVAIRIDIGWEMQTYFSHNGFQSYTPIPTNMMNYSMQGLTAGIKIDF